MMWLVRVALRLPYTFAILAVMIVLSGMLMIFRMPVDIFRTPVDIFPNIDIPVVSVIWTYTGQNPEEMAQRIATYSERAITTTVNDLELTESQSVGIVFAIMLVYCLMVVNFQSWLDPPIIMMALPTANVESARNRVNSNQATVSAAEANVNASQANLRRFGVLQSFQRVTAPFAGVITARNFNQGVLITLGSGNSGNTSLYTITSHSTLLVNVNVPQNLSSSLQSGQAVQIQIRELPQRNFTGKVTWTTNALDPNSRTLLTQVEVSNPEGLIQPGMYANAKFTIARANSPLMLPDSALVVNAQRTQVATATPDQTIHYQSIQIGRDDGTQTEVTAGLNANALILNNSRVDSVERTKVQVREAAPNNSK